MSAVGACPDPVNALSRFVPWEGNAHIDRKTHCKCTIEQRPVGRRHDERKANSEKLRCPHSRTIRICAAARSGRGMPLPYRRTVEYRLAMYDGKRSAAPQSDSERFFRRTGKPTRRNAFCISSVGLRCMTGKDPPLLSQTARDFFARQAKPRDEILCVFRTLFCAELRKKIRCLTAP